jgi:NADPH-dependent ferric siderophore reductase
LNIGARNWTAKVQLGLVRREIRWSGPSNFEEEMNNRPEPKIFEVVSTSMVTPNMRRVSIGGAAMADFPAGQDGGYLKLRIPGAAPADPAADRRRARY